MNAPPKRLESITHSQTNGLINTKKRTVCLLGGAPPIFAWFLQTGRRSVSLDPLLSGNVPSASFPLLLPFTTPTVEWLTDIQTLQSAQENWALLGYYTACSGNFLPTFRDNLSVPCRISWQLKMGPRACPKTSVINYHYKLCNDSERRRSHLILGGGMK